MVTHRIMTVTTLAAKSAHERAGQAATKTSTRPVIMRCVTMIDMLAPLDHPANYFLIFDNEALQSE